MRKDRGRVLRPDKRRTGTADREKASKDVEHKRAPLQEGRKHSSSSRSSSTGGGGKSSVSGLPPDQVVIHRETMTLVFEIPCCGARVALDTRLGFSGS